MGALFINNGTKSYNNEALFINIFVKIILMNH
jgi:hypothetical protein